ncbi:MAG: mannosyltransferase family protein [bacterium]|nr:mannosyltransferase family protein [bacterium]
MNNRLNFNSPIFKILIMFLTWRFILVIVSILAIYFLPLGYKDRFLGGGPTNYQLSPWFFSWANFDGEHYLSISIFGYKYLEQAFFPVYPMIMSFFSRPNAFDLLLSLINSTVVGLLISNVSFLLALIVLWELIRIDFSKKIAYLTIILIIVFPTSFYFGAVYNESLFLLLSVLSFYFARKGNWMAAGLIGMVSSATRIFGIFLLPALLIEAWQQKASLGIFIWILLIPAGLGVYMIYQFFTVGDFIAFYHLQKIVGEQHQSGFTLLPQVYYRYVKMLLTVGIQNPIFQTIVLEFAVGILFFLLPVYGYFKKIRLSYLVYAMLGFLAPTIQGSFSSVPRYVIVFFPSFLAVAFWINSLPKYMRIIILLLSFSALIIESSLFLRGYWVA